MTKRELICALYLKYLEFEPKSEDIILGAQDINKPARLKIINFLKRWVNWDQDFLLDDELIDSFLEFTDKISGEHISLAQQLQKNVRMIMEGEKRQGTVDFASKPPESIIPKTFIHQPTTSGNLVGIFGEVEIARQISIYQQELFRQIESWEFFGCAWTKEDREEKCPNVVRLTTSFNQMSNWVSHQICSTMNLKERTKVLRKWIVIAGEMKKLNNFFGVFSILSGFSSAAVHRLKKTFSALSRDKTKLYEEMVKINAPQKSWANYRAILKVAAPPSVPYLGVYQTDLVFLEGGSPTLTAQGTINFQKCRHMGNIIKDIRKYQNLAYNLTPLSLFQQYLQNSLIAADKITEQELWKLSKEIEP